MEPDGSLTYDANGDILSTSNPDGVKTSYTYDGSDRVTRVSYSDSTSTVAYSYNPDGSGASMVDGSGTTTYTYDGQGDLSTEINGAGEVATEIAIEFAAKVNTAVKGQHLNYSPIEKALTANGGKAFWKAFLDLYNARGGTNAKPDFSRPCLRKPFPCEPPGALHARWLELNMA